MPDDAKLDPNGGAIDAFADGRMSEATVRYASNDAAAGHGGMVVYRAADFEALSWVRLPRGYRYVTGLLLVTQLRPSKVRFDAGSELRWRLDAAERAKIDARARVFLFKGSYPPASAGPFEPTVESTGRVALRLPAGTATSGCAAAVLAMPD